MEQNIKTTVEEIEKNEILGVSFMDEGKSTLEVSEEIPVSKPVNKEVEKVISKKKKEKKIETFQQATKIAASLVGVYSKPDNHSTVIRLIREKESVTVIGEEKDFYKLDDGYVLKRCFK